MSPTVPVTVPNLFITVDAASNASPVVMDPAANLPNTSDNVLVPLVNRCRDVNSSVSNLVRSIGGVLFPKLGDRVVCEMSSNASAIRLPVSSVN